ncbi:unnamed protein product [Ceutorhynchus assimilis]|uniref:Tantalus-like domain-containing protein n=1 Tax=Ceutorhynchus assimilis TaxID=467358 RepID=A0A9N9MMB6_9CUCU|nr:unnamed protein product [Ceutorhynchus assimilis]
MEVEQIDLSALQIKDQKPQSEETRLALLESCNGNGETSVIRRSGRMKIMPLEEASKTRPVIKKSKKLELNSQSSQKTVEKYYLSQKIKLTSTTLETIFEEPEQNSVFSTRKMRRSINFAKTTFPKADKSKVKKRSMKAKKILKGGFKKLNKKLGLEMLMKKLKELDSDDD